MTTPSKPEGIRGLRVCSLYLPILELTESEIPGVILRSYLSQMGEAMRARGCREWETILHCHPWIDPQEPVELWPEPEALSIQLREIVL